MVVGDVSTTTAIPNTLLYSALVRMGVPVFRDVCESLSLCGCVSC
jgi:hypothetical protein